MRTSLIVLTLVLVLSSCRKRPARPHFGGSFSTAEFIEELEPTDSYLSVGTFLQKELDKPGNEGKVVKVYTLMRQEASLKKNFGLLKSNIEDLSQSAKDAIEASEKAGWSTAEFEIEIGRLKSSIPKINKAVSSIELSLAEFKE